MTDIKIGDSVKMRSNIFSKGIPVGVEKIDAEVVEIKNNRILVKILSRGIGWDTESKKFVGVKKNGGWYLGKRHDFGQTIECSLSIISKN